MGWGTLGYAFPAALGAALAGRGPTVVRVAATAASCSPAASWPPWSQEEIPLTAVIVDDGGYGMLRYDQALAGAEPYGVDLHTPDFAALATSFGLRVADGRGARTTTSARRSPRHVADPGPSVLVARAPGMVPPPSTSPNWYRKRGG